MTKGIFITGTDTDIGKTFITAEIMKELRENNINATYFKSVLSGAEIEGDKLIPGDARKVCEASNLEKDYFNIVSYILKMPASPHLSARLENIDIKLDKIKNDFNKLKKKYDYIIVEGSGGIVCPIKLEDETILLEDIIKELKLSTIVVARAGLGTINHTCLTISYLKAKGIKVKGVILNEYNPQNVIHRDNADVIERLTGINIIARVSFVDKNSFPGDKIMEYKQFIELMDEI